MTRGKRGLRGLGRLGIAKNSAVNVPAGTVETKGGLGFPIQAPIQAMLQGYLHMISYPKLESREVHVSKTSCLLM